MLGAVVGQVLRACFLGIAAPLLLLGLAGGSPPGEEVPTMALPTLRGGDSGVGEQMGSCDSRNGFVPNCLWPGTACLKCSVSSGGKRISVPGAHGWRVVSEYPCGVVERGTCDVNYVCRLTVPTSIACEDLELVERQPIVGSDR